MKEFKSVCSNPWCKATFTYTESDMIVIKNDKVVKNFDPNDETVKKVKPKVCKKCKSFDNEMSGGVTWEDREYEGDIDYKTPHEIKYKVTNYRF